MTRSARGLQTTFQARHDQPHVSRMTATSRLPNVDLPWGKRWQELVEHLHLIHTETEVEQFIEDITKPAKPRTLAFVNAHAMNCTVSNQSFHQGLMAANELLRDGSGMAILLRALNCKPGINLNGTDLIPRVIARYSGQCIALFGTQAPFLENAAQLISAKLAPGSHCVTTHGFLNDDHYLQAALVERPALVVLGMGMPKQERVAELLREHLQHPCLIICGGAILDFLGGKVRRAPKILRLLGLEWLFRLTCEPRRLFNRYVIGNPVFIARAMWFAVHEKFGAINPAKPGAKARSTRS